jgi:ABC-type thiamine transport system ATPase subunit
MQLVTLGSDVVNLAAAEKVLADTIAHCSAQTKANIEAFISLSLQQIFGDPALKVELLQEVKRDRVETRIIINDGDGTGPPAKVAGGGVQNVLGFLLRFLALRRMNLKPVLILDEAFRNVSANHLDTLCSFLKHLTEDHGLDILLVSHEPAFMRIADIFYEVNKSSSHGLVITSQSTKDSGVVV